ncbi:TPA: hypothetical protein ACH3X3_008799 [Trebouxia sp. C0006]
MNMQAREQPLDLPTSAGHGTLLRVVIHTRIPPLHASTAVQLYAPAVQGADHGQNAPLLQASDAPVNIDASESVLSAPDLPNEFKGAERALQAWQQHKFALWLYMVVSGLVIALSVQNHFIPTILPATLGQQLAMWGLLFLTWKPDRKLRNIEEFLQASTAAVLSQAKCVVQQGGSMVTALFSIALAFVFAGHKLNCFEIGQVCIYSEGIDDWRKVAALEAILALLEGQDLG